MSATMTATLRMRDLMSSRLRTAGRGLGRFTRQVDQGRGRIGRFSASVANMGARLGDAFGSRASRLVRGFFTGLKISSAIGTIALGRFVAGGIAKAKELETTLRQTTSLIASQADINAKAGTPWAVDTRNKLADQRFQEFNDLILRISPKLAADPNRVAEGVYDIVSAGYESLADVEGILTAATKAATAGRADPDVAVKALVTTLQSYGDKLGDFPDESKKAEFVVDQMFQAVNTGLITFSEMAENLGKVTGTAAQAGVSFEELMAAVQITTLKGLQPDIAMTSLNRILTSMIAPSPQEQEAAAGLFGTDGKAGLEMIEEKFTSKIDGKTSAIDAITDNKDMDASAKRNAKRKLREDISWLKSEMKDALDAASEDSLRGVWGPQALARNGLLGQLQMIRKVIDPTTEEMEALNSAISSGNNELADALVANMAGDKVEALTDLFGDIRGLRSALALTSDEGKTFEHALMLQGQSLGAVNRAFDEQAKTAGFAEDQLRSYINVVRIKLGQEALPLIADAARAISGYIDTNILSNPAFENAEGMDKFKVIGEVLWKDIVGWWESNQDEIALKAEGFFNWLGEKAIPWAVDAGVALGKSMGPPLFDALVASIKELMQTTEGGLLLAGFLSMKGAQIGAKGGMFGGGTGAAGAAGGAGMITKLAVGALTITAAAVAVHTAVTEYFDQKKGVKEQSKTVREMTTGAIADGNWSNVVDAYKGGHLDWAGQLGTKVLDTDTPRSAITKGLFDYFNENIAQWKADKDMAALDEFSSGLHDSGAFKELNDSQQNDLNSAIRASKVRIAQSVGAWNSEMDGIMQEALQDKTMKGKGIADGKGTEGFDRLVELAKKDMGGAGDVARDYLSRLTYWSEESYSTIIDKEQDRTQALLNSASAMDDLTAKEINRINQIYAALLNTFGASGFLEGSTDAGGRTVLPPGFVGPVGPNSVRSEDLGNDPYVNFFGHIVPKSAVDALANKDKKQKQDARANGSDEHLYNLGNKASGVVGTLRTPTTLRVAERGPEDISVIPHSKGGIRSGAGGASIVVQGPLLNIERVDGDTDVEDVADKLVTAMEKRIAGR